MIPFDGSLLIRSVYSIDLAMGQEMLDPGGPVLDLVFFAPEVRHVSRVRGCRIISGAGR
jgi:hypothetical protein